MSSDWQVKHEAFAGWSILELLGHRRLIVVRNQMSTTAGAFQNQSGRWARERNKPMIMQNVRQRIIRFAEHIGRRRTQIALGPMLLAAKHDEIDTTVKRLGLDARGFDTGTMAMVQKQG